MLASKICSIISAYLCSCSCQYCYHIKQKYCIFLSPKAFCNTHKVVKGRFMSVIERFRLLKSRLRPALPPDPAGGAHDAGSPSRLGRGHPFLIPTPSTGSASRYRFSELPPIFAYGPVSVCGCKHEDAYQSSCSALHDGASNTRS